MLFINLDNIELLWNGERMKFLTTLIVSLIIVLAVFIVLRIYYKDSKFVSFSFDATIFLLMGSMTLSVLVFYVLPTKNVTVASNKMYNYEETRDLGQKLVITEDEYGNDKLYSVSIIHDSKDGKAYLEVRQISRVLVYWENFEVEKFNVAYLHMP